MGRQAAGWYARLRASVGGLSNLPILKKRMWKMITKHTLNMKCGITIDLYLDEETCQMRNEWNPGPPYSKEIQSAIPGEYEPWIAGILQAWCNKTGKKVMMVFT